MGGAESEPDPTGGRQSSTLTRGRTADDAKNQWPENGKYFKSGKSSQSSQTYSTYRIEFEKITHLIFNYI